MNEFFRKVARRISSIVGSVQAFIVAVLVVVAWFSLGSHFHYSTTWQLVINTGTTIVTFIMVFIIQNTQNRDSKAMHLKMDELIHIHSKARNRLVELEEDADFKILSEDQKRIFLRNELKEHNKNLASTAKDSGVITSLDFAIFQDHGYKGLYAGLGAKDIHTRKELKKSQQILDHMGSTELAANLFRATQTEDKLKRENIKSKKQANQTHYDVGVKVRQTIKELGGTMPEDLPAEEDVKKVQRRLNSEGKKLTKGTKKLKR